MALARSLTKKLQKLRSRANSEATSPTSPSGPAGTINPAGPPQEDYFYSISFEQTSRNLSPSSSNGSLSTAGSPVTPGDLNLHSQRIYASSTVNSLGSDLTTPLGSSTNLAPMSAKPPSYAREILPLLHKQDSTPHLQMYPGDKNSTVASNTGSRLSIQSSAASSVYSQSASVPTDEDESIEDQLFVSNPDGSIEPISYREAREFDADDTLDARADEMAMNILEKVSADDYLREIKTGSWYI